MSWSSHPIGCPADPLRLVEYQRANEPPRQETRSQFPKSIRWLLTPDSVVVATNHRRYVLVQIDRRPRPNSWHESSSRDTARRLEFAVRIRGREFPRSGRGRANVEPIARRSGATPAIDRELDRWPDRGRQRAPVRHQ